MELKMPITEVIRILKALRRRKALKLDYNDDLAIRKAIEVLEQIKEGY